MTGKYRLLVGTLARRSERAIFVTTKNGAEGVRDEFERSGGDPDRLGVVDCVPYADPTRRHGTDDLVRTTNSVDNLTRIGIKFTELFERFRESSGDPAGVGIHSISPLLMHTGMEPVYQFLHVLVGQVRRADWFGAVVVDTAIAREDVGALEHHFDGVLETRDDDRREYRVRGFDAVPSAWVRF